MVNSKFDVKYFEKKLNHVERLRSFIDVALENRAICEDDVCNMQVLQYLIKEVMQIKFRGSQDWIKSLGDYFISNGGFRAFLEKPICTFSPTLSLAAYVERQVIL